MEPKTSQKLLIDKITRVFDKYFVPQIKHKNLVYQDISPCDVLIANVYKIDEGEYKYYVESSGELKFKVSNLLEVFDCITDISKTYKIYGKCWNLYNKIRKNIDSENYERYSIYVSDYIDESGKWLIDFLDAF